LAPFGAGGADVVVWWEKGFYNQEDEAVREMKTLCVPPEGQRQVSKTQVTSNIRSTVTNNRPFFNELVLNISSGSRTCIRGV
jgi:hypothetical protein